MVYLYIYLVLGFFVAFFLKQNIDSNNGGLKDALRIQGISEPGIAEYIVLTILWLPILIIAINPYK